MAAELQKELITRFSIVISVMHKFDDQMLESYNQVIHMD